MGKKHYRSILYIIGGILAVCTAFPIIYMLANSVMSAQEIIESYQVSAGEYTNFHLVPGHFSLEQYYRAFFSRARLSVYVLELCDLCGSRGGGTDCNLDFRRLCFCEAQIPRQGQTVFYQRYPVAFADPGYHRPQLYHPE